MRLFVALGALLVFACAPVPEIEAALAKPKLQSVGAEVKSWGVMLRKWTVDAEGRVEHTSGGRPGQAPADTTIDVRRLVLPAASRVQLAEAIERVKAVLATPEHCDERLTDGPYGTFSWDEGAGAQQLKIDGNCVKGRDAQLSEAIFAVDKIVDDAAKATEPVERHPATQDR